jgi:hypothetical protein
MKSPIVFRADFQQPRESAMRIPAVIGVEVYQSLVGRAGGPGEWKARRPGTRIDFPRITPQSRPETLMRQIPLVNFETQLTGYWQAFDSRQSPPRPIEKGRDWRFDKDGKPQFTQEYEESVARRTAGAKS